MALNALPYVPTTLSFWDGTQIVKIVYNGSNDLRFPGYFWPLGWWGVNAPERSTHRVSVLRSAGGGGAITAWLYIEDDTAVRGVDYDFTNVTPPFPLDNVGNPLHNKYIAISWAEGEIGPKSYPITLHNTDSDKRFRVTLHFTRRSGISHVFDIDQRVDGYLVSTRLPEVNNNYYVTVKQQPDEHGTVGFVQPSYYLDENQTTTAPATVQVYRQSGSVGAVSVNYHTIDGTGIAGIDYESTSGTLNWDDGESGPKSISVQLNDVTGDKTFSIVLSGQAGGVYLNPAADVAEVTIADFAGSGRVSFETLLVQGESGDTVQVVVNRIGGASGDISVNIDLDDGTALGGVNYTDDTDTITFLDGDNTPQIFNIDLIGSSPTPLSFTARLHSPVDTTIIDGFDIATIFVLPTGAQEVPIIQDLLEGSFNPYSRRDEIIDDPTTLTRRDILVNVMQQLDGTGPGEIGWGSGASLYGGSSDYMTPGAYSNTTWRQKHSLTVRQIML